MSDQNLVEQLVELAMEIEAEDPIDFGMLRISERDAYTLMATGVLDMYNATAAEQREMIMLATILKLTVENLVLNMTLLQK